MFVFGYCPRCCKRDIDVEIVEHQTWGVIFWTCPTCGHRYISVVIYPPTSLCFPPTDTIYTN